MAKGKSKGKPDPVLARDSDSESSSSDEDTADEEEAAEAETEQIGIEAFLKEQKISEDHAKTFESEGFGVRVLNACHLPPFYVLF